MPSEPQLHALEIQHNLVPEPVREALAQAIMNATVTGHSGVTTVILTLMGMTAAGKITHEQADMMTRQAELLFTNIAAQNIQKKLDEKGGGSEAAGDPLAAQIALAQAKAKKLRPAMLLSDDGGHEYGMEVLNADGPRTSLLDRTD